MGTISYVVAATLINSKDVVYEDNSNLMADNVQDAIDGTCTKIDTRLSGIEDNLYTIKNIHTEGNFYNSTSLAYTGISITLPEDSYCTITAMVKWSSGLPLKVQLNTSSTDRVSALTSNEGNTEKANSLSTTYSAYSSRALTLYLWAQYDTSNALNDAYIEGFCATKYK